MRQPFGAPAGGVSAAGATTPGDDEFEAGPVQAWFTQLVQASQGIKPGTSSTGPRKPPVPPKPRPKPKITPSAKKKLKFTPGVSSAELVQELPYSGTYSAEPWDTPADRAEKITKAIERDIRKKTPSMPGYSLWLKKRKTLK